MWEMIIVLLNFSYPCHINIELWALKTRYLWMFWHNFLEKVIFVWSDVEWDQPLQSPLQLLWKITDSQITTSVHPPSSNLQGPLFTWQRSNSTWGKESSDKALVMIWYNHPELQCCTVDALNLDWIYLYTTRVEMLFQCEVSDEFVAVFLKCLGQE